MRGATCFSGIGSPEVALPDVDWVWHSEIEPFPCAVMAVRHPGNQNLGDILAPDFIQRAKALGPLDLIIGGPPCQAFSVAGLRQSLADPRGNLSLRYVQVLHAIRPRVAVTENVPGWLSTGDNAFGCFLAGVVGADAPLVSPLERGRWPYHGMVCGPLARAAWRTLDAQYVRVDQFPWAVPQRRRRVFVVISFGDDGIDPAKVLFERESLSGHPAPRRQAGQSAAPTLAARTRGGGGLGTDFDCDGGLIATADSSGDSAAVMSKWAKGSGGPAGDECQNLVAHAISPPITSNPYGDHESRDGLLVAHSLRADGFDASEDGTGRGTPLVPICIHADAIGRSGEAATPSPDAEGRVRLRDAGMGVSEGTAFGLTTGAPHAVSFQTRGSNLDTAGEVAATLGQNCDRASGGAPCIAFSSKDHGADAGDISPTLRSMGHDASHANGGGQVAIAIQERAVCENPDAGPQGAGFNADGAAYTLEARHHVQAVAFAENSRAASGGSSRSSVAESWVVRRLTPLECERLMGLPECRESATILICQNSSDHQKSDAHVGRQCRNAQSNAQPAAAQKSRPSARRAERPSGTNHPGQGSLVEVRVLIDLERMAAEIHSPERSFSPVALAGGRGRYPLPTGIESFAHLAALTMQIAGQLTPDGRVESRSTSERSTPRLSGSTIATVFGREIDELAADAEINIEAMLRLSTSTTSLSGQDIEALRSTLKILCCYVARVIDGFIPERIRAENSCSVRLETIKGWTAITYRNKPAADGPRYKAIGNSMAVNVMRWIGTRIAWADECADGALGEVAA